MSEHMYISEKVYERGAPYKTTIREGNNLDSLDSKYKGGEAISPTKTEKSCAVKNKKNHAGHPSDWPNG